MLGDVGRTWGVCGVGVWGRVGVGVDVWMCGACGCVGRVGMGVGAWVLGRGCWGVGVGAWVWVLGRELGVQYVGERKYCSPLYYPDTLVHKSGHLPKAK